MNYAVCRINKIKRRELAAVHGHNMRTLDVKHRDPEGIFKRLLGDKQKTIEQLVNDVIEKYKGKLVGTIRRDAVIAVEIVLSASPDYFRPSNAHLWGKYEHDRTEDWCRRALKFLEIQYKKRLIEASMHLDEGTPHLHAVVVPLVRTERKRRRTKLQIQNDELGKTIKGLSFCAKKLFSKANLIKLQDDYAEAMKPLGLKRGIKGSKSSHQKVKDYYALVNSDRIQEKLSPNYPILTKPPIIGADKWLKKTQLSLNEEIDILVNALVEEANNIRQQAVYYKQQYKNELQRTRKYWYLFDGPQNAQNAFENLSTKVKEQEQDIANQASAIENLLSKNGIETINELTQEKFSLLELIRQKNLRIKELEGQPKSREPKLNR